MNLIPLYLTFHIGVGLAILGIALWDNNKTASFVVTSHLLFSVMTAITYFL